MKINKLIEYSQKEYIGKYYLAKAVAFTFNKEFGKAYEFFKDGLDLLTCDCQRDWLNPNADTNKKIFDDINVKHIPHYEYYFVKAYIMSYEEDKKSLYLALDAIDKYLEVKNDEYGNYLKGKILLALNENQQAYLYFEQAASHKTNPRLIYRLGRTKEELLEQGGLDELYFSFIQNPSSACCARVLKKYMKEQEFNLELKINEKNPLLLAFNNDEDEWKFQHLYEEMLKSQVDNKEELPFEVIDYTDTINYFVKEMTRNYNLFIYIYTNGYGPNDDYDNFENSDFSSDYEKYGGYNDWSDDVIDDVFEGDPLNTWNVE